MKKLMLSLVVIAAAMLLLSACASKPASTGNDKPVPADYAGKTNPVAGNADAIAAGKQTFTDNCVSCHGEGGKGDGPAGASLDPHPADLTKIAKTLSDDRINWVIHEGGAAAGLSSSMASWKGTLSDDQIWQVIAYIHTLP